MRKFTRFLVVLGFSLCFAQGGFAMDLTSPEFKENGIIPPRFTCQGEDINPRLDINFVPEETQSLVLIVDDPDAPLGTWVHWVAYDIKPSIQMIAENSVPGVQGWNDFDRAAWGGPCPPDGIHRYFFKLYALDIKLDLDPGAKKAEVERAMDGHILDKALLIGLYTKF